MNGVKGIDQNTISLQIKSLFVFDFLNEFNELEHIIRDVFEENLSHMSDKIIRQLYFYYGSKIGTYIEYESHAVKISNIVFKDEESFKDLSINQIIKIFKKTNGLDAFDFSVRSIQRSATEYSFYDCAIRLLNMRNKLAHEVSDLQFKNQDIIELLTFEQISQEPFDLLQNYDLQKMDNMTQYIASNIVYIRKLISKLKTE